MATIDENAEFFYKETNESLVNNFDNLPQITQLNYNIKEKLDVKKTGDKTLVAIIWPSYYETQTTILIVDEYDDECRDSYSIPANKNKIILCEERDNYEGFYPVSTYTSTSNNMRFAYSLENGPIDFIIQHLAGIPLFIEKKNQARQSDLNTMGQNLPYLGQKMTSYINLFIVLEKNISILKKEWI